MKLIKLTTPKGDPVWINIRGITRVRIAPPDVLGETVIDMGGNFQAVREPIESIAKALSEMDDE